MASTLSELRTTVLRSLARNDSVAVAVANAAINYALIIASLTFMPQEMYKVQDITVTGGNNYIDLSATNDDEGNIISANLLDVIKLYDADNSYKLHFVPYEHWDVYVPAALDYTKYWTLFNHTIYLKDTPDSNLDVELSYSIYPLKLTENDDELPFDNHDAYIVSSATGIAFAVFEENEAASMWAQIANSVGEPLVFGAKAKSIIEGQRLLIEGVVAQTGG